MKKDDLLMNIADTAYNIGFGAKKNFATYDIVKKIPRLINFISLSFGIYALISDSLSAKYLSATLLIVGIIGIYISFYDPKKYEETGKNLTKLFYELKNIYDKVKHGSEEDLEEQSKKLEKIQQESIDLSISEQIVFSNWYAHYKFFWEHRISWVDEQKKFTFFRDKIPLSLTIFIILSLSIIISLILIFFNPDVKYVVCYFLNN